MAEITLKRTNSGRPLGSKMPMVYKPAHVPIRKSYFEEYNERNKKDLETEEQMKARLFDG